MGLFKLANDTATGKSAHHWLLPLVLLTVAFLLLLGGDAYRGVLRFEPAAVEVGQYWRLLTGHLVHLGWSHFALNAAGLVLIWYLVGDAWGHVHWLLIALTSLAVIDAGLWILHPQLQWYVGLSGLLHGILAGGLVANYRRRGAETLVLAALLLAKLAWEQVVGPLPGSETSSGGSVIIDAHLYGAVGGILMALLVLIRVRRGASI